MAGVKHTFSTAIADDASAQAAGMVLPSTHQDTQAFRAEVLASLRGLHTKIDSKADKP